MMRKAVEEVVKWADDLERSERAEKILKKK